MFHAKLFPYLLVLTSLYWVSTAHAETMVIPLSAEGWVTTQSADVRVQFTVVPTEGAEDKTRARVFETLEDLDTNDTWHVTHFHQSIGQAGLTTWSVRAQSRVSGASYTDLTRAVEKASKPGFQVRVTSMTFTPSLAERMAARMAVRSQVRTMAVQEAAGLTRSTGTSWRVVGIDFAPFANPAAPPMMRTMAVQAEGAHLSTDLSSKPQGPSAIPVAERFTVQGIITLETAE